MKKEHNKNFSIDSALKKFDTAHEPNERPEGNLRGAYFLSPSHPGQTMTTQQHKALCGAATRRGHACRNPSPAGGGFCRLHASNLSSSAKHLADDPLEHLQLLQDAALRRALAVHLAEEDGLSEEKKDAAFGRNARLAATIARLRMALVKAGDEPKAQGGEEAAPLAELVVYKLPDNGR